METQQQRLSERDKTGKAVNAKDQKEELQPDLAILCSDPLEKLGYQKIWAAMYLRELEKVQKRLDARLQAFRAPETGGRLLDLETESNLAPVQKDLEWIQQEMDQVRELVREKENKGGGELVKWLTNHGEEMERVLSYFGSAKDIHAPMESSYSPYIERLPISIEIPARYEAYLCFQYYLADHRLVYLHDLETGQSISTNPMDTDGMFRSMREYFIFQVLTQNKFLNLPEEKERLKQLKQAVKERGGSKFDEFDRKHGDEMREKCGEFASGELVGGLILLELLSLALNFVPGVNTAISAQQFLTGVDLITGRELSGGDRVLALIGAIPLFGSLVEAGEAAKGVKIVEDMSEMEKIVKEESLFFPRTQRKIAQMVTGAARSTEKSKGVIAAKQIIVVSNLERSPWVALLSEKLEPKAFNLASKTEKAEEIAIDVTKAAADKTGSGLWLVQKSGSKTVNRFIEFTNDVTKKAAKADRLILTIDEASKLPAVTKAIQSSPNLSIFERAFREAYVALEPAERARITGFEISGKTAIGLFEGTQSELRDLDLMILAQDDATKMRFFRKVQEVYGKRLLDDKIIFWKGWRAPCDSGVVLAQDAGNVRAAYEAVESKALLRFVGDALEKTHLDNSLLVMDDAEKVLTKRRIWETAKDSLKKVQKILDTRAAGTAEEVKQLEDESKYVVKLHKALEVGKERIPRKYLEIAEKATRQLLARTAGILDHIPPELRLKPAEAKEFLEYWAKKARPPLWAETSRLIRLNIEMGRKNALRVFQEIGFRSEDIMPKESTERLAEIARLFKDAKDFTEWWDKVTNDDVTLIANSLREQEDEETHKDFETYQIDQPGDSGEFNVLLPSEKTEN